MANVQAKDFQTLVQEQATAIQGGSSRFLVDFSVGSILRAVVEAYSAVAMWLQGMVLQLLATTRAATSNGSDLDSWMADYGLTRLSAAAATGVVSFARFTPTHQAVVPIGAVVQTADGTQKYAVQLDVSNTAYSASQNGYVLAAGVASVSVPVEALAAGSAGNAAVGGISLLGQAMPGVDTVSNAAALVNGEDAETDAALRTRFVAYMASLSKATKAAVGYAISSLQQGLNYTLVENQSYAGAAQPGYFYLVVDDGTGHPSTTLLSTVFNAVDAVRPVASTFGVFPPTVAAANVSLSISTATGADHAGTVVLVSTAITSYINALPLGAGLAWSRLAQVAYDASPAVVNVTAVQLNGGTADLSASSQQVVKAGSVTVA